MKKEFNLYEIIIVGIVNKNDPDGVFTPKTLGNIYKLTQFIKTLRWKNKEIPNQFSGVINIDLVAPSMVEHISQKEPGTIKFEWLMTKPPKTQKEALLIKKRLCQIHY